MLAVLPIDQEEVSRKCMMVIWTPEELVFVQFPAPPPQTHLPPDSPLMLGFRVYNLDLGFSALGV